MRHTKTFNEFKLNEALKIVKLHKDWKYTKAGKELVSAIEGSRVNEAEETKPFPNLTQVSSIMMPSLRGAMERLKENYPGVSEYDIYDGKDGSKTCEITFKGKKITTKLDFNGDSAERMYNAFKRRIDPNYSAGNKRKYGKKGGGSFGRMITRF